MKLSLPRLDWRVGQSVVAYTETVDAAAGPIVVSVAGGSLPDGLRLENNVIVGTPTTPGPYDFTLSARDIINDTAALRVTGVIDEAVAPAPVPAPLAAPEPTQLDLIPAPPSLNDRLGEFASAVAGDVRELERRLANVATKDDLVGAISALAPGIPSPALPWVDMDLANAYRTAKVTA